MRRLLKRDWLWRFWALVQMGLVSAALKGVFRKRRRFPNPPELKEKLVFPWEGTSVHVCFGCAPQNATSLGLEFFRTADGNVACTWLVRKGFENFPGMLHGGVSASILDEIMGTIVYFKTRHLPLSRSMKVQWHKGIRVGERVMATARIEKSSANLYSVRSYLFRSGGKVAVEGKGLYFTPPYRVVRRLVDASKFPQGAQSWFRPERRV